jgi:hypothetical protein
MTRKSTFHWLGAIAISLGLVSVAQAKSDLVPVGKVAAAVVGYPNADDFYSYRAVMVEAEEGNDLYIFINTYEGWKQAAHAKEIVWSGGIGQEASLEVAENGWLKVKSQNSSIGRDRWEQTLTVVYRKGAFRVAGYTHSYYDTLNPEAAGTCDVNLLTGRGTHKGKTFKTVLQALPVSEWAQDTGPDECGFEQ